MKLADRFGKITIGDKEYLLVEEVVLESMLKENILNRDAVMDIFAKFEGEALAYRQHGKETFPIAEKYTDIICSLSLPVLSEEEIDKAVTDYIDEQFVGLDPLVWADEIKFAKSHFLHGFKACQQLTKPKKKEK